MLSIASVYTDSSYSTKSNGYEEEEQYFLVKEDRQFGATDGLQKSEAAHRRAPCSTVLVRSELGADCL
jgi:hypothetical protein